MTIENLAEHPEDAVFTSDVVIVGGGACGLTLARELAGSGLDILVVESGLIKETAEHDALNEVELLKPTWSDEARAARAGFYEALTEHWNADIQAFGVRCRGLGGSTLAWAGKSATFDEIDFERREWVPLSGWPIDRASLEAYFDRAAVILNLAPNCYNEELWNLIGGSPPSPAIAKDAVTSFFWQFSRSRLKPPDSMRLGADFLATRREDVRILLNATTMRTHVNEEGTRFRSLDIQSIDGRHARVNAKVCVLAAGAIENARLLLVSNDRQANGLGNGHDQVGRYLMEHLMVPLGEFDAARAKEISARFGLFGVRHGGRTHMYLHGLALSHGRQCSEQLLNGAAFVVERLSQTDPVDAAARLLKRRSKAPLRDLGILMSSPTSLIKAFGLRALEHDRMPDAVRHAIVETVLRRLPNQAAREYQFRGLPHKLDGAIVQGICEQPPSATNRVLLSKRTNSLGQCLPRIEWHPGDAARNTLLRMGELVAEAFADAQLPMPKLPDWIRDREPEAAPVIDAGHTLGTTRMSDDARFGVVDRNARVHDVDGLYIAGGSVMPTSGHANPTLMMLALTVRLADHIKTVMTGRQPARQSK
jgi:choline dehydrogenase-like flavoprotein